MKLVLYMAFLLSSFSIYSAEFKLRDLSGIYSVTPVSPIAYLEDGMTFEYQLAISTNQDEFGHNIIGLNEVFKKVLDDGTETVLGELKCSGVAIMNKDHLVTANISCDNHKTFEQRINLADVANPLAAEFQAPVFSSLYGMELEMNFKKSSPKKK
jgi:hypothetical protein